MKRTILVVDDEPDIRGTLKAILELEDFQVLTAEHGAAALQAIDGALPDLIIADYMMPYMNGRELLQKLKSSPQARTIPVILSSAVSPPGPAIWDAFLRKPADMEEILATIRRLLEDKDKSM